MANVKEMRRKEAKETRAQERQESPSYQKREEKLGIEKHKHSERKEYKGGKR